MTYVKPLSLDSVLWCIDRIRLMTPEDAKVFLVQMRSAAVQMLTDEQVTHLIALFDLGDKL